METNQFGSEMPRSGADGKACAQFEATLADAVDGLLTPEEQATFDEHARSCAACSVQLAEAQRGAAWLSMLKVHPPEPDAALVDRILAETSVRTAAELEAMRAEQRARAQQASLLGGSLRAPVAAPIALPAGAGVLPFRTRVALRLRPITHTVLQPRFMMTAAMAFFFDCPDAECDGGAAGPDPCERPEALEPAAQLLPGQRACGAVLRQSARGV